MKKLVLAVLTFCLTLPVFADVRADGSSFCIDSSFKQTLKYVAIKDANTYFDAFADEYAENAKIKGKKIKKGAIVTVYSIGANCRGGNTIFMNIQQDGFVGVKKNDFKEIK